MKRLWITILGFLLGAAAFASHFSGSYTDQQTGTTITIQQGDDGRMQGAYAGPSGQFQFMGDGNQQGAYGSMMTPEGVLGFQAQLSPDNQQLQFALFQFGADGQATPMGQPLLLQRSGAAGGMQPGGAQQPGWPPTPGQMLPPGGIQGGAQQPDLPFPPAGAVPMAPVQPPAQTPAGAWTGAPTSVPPAPVLATWNQPLVGDAGQIVMVVQQGQEGSYSGYFDAYGQRHPFSAQGNESFLDGSFQTADGEFQFYAEQQPDGTVHLFTADAQYILQPGGPGAGQGLP